MDYYWGKSGLKDTNRIEYLSSSGLQGIGRTGKGVVADFFISVGMIHGNGRLYYISRPSTRTVSDCVVSAELVLEHKWTVLCQ